MRVIDTHCHVTPDAIKRRIRSEGEWLGVGPSDILLHREGFRRSIAQRLEDMEERHIDSQLLSPTVGLYQYGAAPARGAKIARQCNEGMADLVRRYPDRFMALATLPMQDEKAALRELTYATEELGLAGVIVGDHVNGVTFDAPEFNEFFGLAEELGSVIMFHQGLGGTCVKYRIDRYGLSNSIGNLVERALAVSAMIFGGVLDRFPRMKPLLAHGGGVVPYVVGRIDKSAGALNRANAARMVPRFEETRAGARLLRDRPSDYLDRFYYDSCTFSESVLKFLIDAVGIERVVLGSDYPAPMATDDPVSWIESLPLLSDEEKRRVLCGNAARMLGIGDTVHYTSDAHNT